MQTIPKDQVIQRLAADNPWWVDPANLSAAMRGLKPRAYFDLFFPLVAERSVRRAVILMGPRRVGKTVLIHHVIQVLVEQGVRAANVCYLSVDHPLYTGCGLDQLLAYYAEASGVDIRTEQAYIFFDEIQYLKTWEIHLKSLVDRYPNLKFIASGSAAAALRLKSIESGAGRFTEFLLPPLTFHEYLELIGVGDTVHL
ncbi:MAG TPA: AAA family ATPase, partial [Gemmatimonadaceae bacterium]|nr:AAA family ATPase [Gemmatimonadaceae bacterium]